MWPVETADLVRLQQRISEELSVTDPWTAQESLRIGGCFVAFARGEAGPGRPGDRAWAGAVVWDEQAVARRRNGLPWHRADAGLRGRRPVNGARHSALVVADAVASAEVPAAYRAGLLAAREGAVLADAVGRLAVRPDVLLVDATGLDHPRGAGLAVHLGWVSGLPTVGVTNRPLVGSGTPPGPERGDWSPLLLEGRPVGRWLRTRPGARPVLAHAAWRTDPPTAVDVVLRASTAAARTPVPLQEARRLAREARSAAGLG